MSKITKSIKHDGGTHKVEMLSDGSDLVIRFGSSFTLRVDEKTAWDLRDMIHDAALKISIIRND